MSGIMNPDERLDIRVFGCGNPGDPLACVPKTPSWPRGFRKYAPEVLSTKHDMNATARPLRARLQDIRPDRCKDKIYNVLEIPLSCTYDCLPHVNHSSMPRGTKSLRRRHNFAKRWAIARRMICFYSWNCIGLRSQVGIAWPRENHTYL